MSTGDGKRGKETIFRVPTLDAASFVKHTVDLFRPKATLMKMDIEGSEYVALPKMLRDGILCKKYIGAIKIEWHWRYHPENATKDAELSAAIDGPENTKRCANLGGGQKRFEGSTTRHSFMTTVH